MWRIMRVINGFILGAKQAADGRVHEQKRRVEQLEQELEQLKSPAAGQDEVELELEQEVKMPAL